MADRDFGVPGVVPPPGRAAPRGLALIAHGRDGSAAAEHMRAIAAAYGRAGWATATPQLRFSRAAPSSGDAMAFSMGAHLDDLRAALEVARAAAARCRPRPRLGLAGHSMGAWAAAMATEACQDVAHLLAVSPVVSGDALLAARARMGRPALEALRREVPRAFDEWPGRDARPALAALAAPVAVIVGEADGLTPPADARAFFAAAASGRFFAVVPDAHHCPEGPTVDRLLDAALVALGAGG